MTTEITIFEPQNVGTIAKVAPQAFKENSISEEMLLDAFVRSANSVERPSVESWRDRWHVIIGTSTKRSRHSLNVRRRH